MLTLDYIYSASSKPSLYSTLFVPLESSGLDKSNFTQKYHDEC